MKKNPLMAPGLRTLAALFLFSVLLFGQASDSILVGSVTDPTGAAVPGASVTATNKDTNVKYTTTANNSGEFRLNNVPIGRYDVTASAKGFAAATVADLQLELNHTVSANLTLSVGSVSTTVEVQEASATIDTASAQLSTTFDTRAALDIPSASQGSGIYNLSLLGAGVASSGGVGQGTGPSIAGQRPENNSFYIDGVNNDDHYVTGPQATLPNDAIAEFTLVQNQMSAEFGGASGGVFNAIMKSGTNQIHGSAYEYMQNRKLNAVDQQEVQQGLYSNPRYDNNRLGGTIGGPILKDKLFYFGLYEYNPIGNSAQPGQTVYAPTSAGLSILNGMSNLSKTNLGVFEKYVPVAPTATNDNPITVNGVNIPNGPLSFASPAYSNQHNFVIAVDYNLSAKDQFRVRYVYNHYAGLDTVAALPVFFANAPNVNNQVSLSEFHNFSASMENEIRLSFSRNNASTQANGGVFPGFTSFPNIAIDDIQLQMGPDPNTPTGSIENKAQLQENLTKSWGAHTFKMGYNLTDVILSGYFVQRARGDYDYASLQEYLLDQQPSGGDLSGVSGERSVGSSDVPFGFLQHAAYFQDDWRVRPNLTLNLGIRYEYATMPVGSRYQANNAAASVPGLTFGKPSFSPNDWAPRFGFAYSPGKAGVWSIRGGFARSFDNTYINLNQNSSPPYFATTVDVDPNNPISNFLANGGLKSALAGPAPTAAQLRAATASYTFGGDRPNAITGTLGVQRLLGKDYTVEARYVYTRGIHLWNQTRLNIISNVTASQNIPTYLSVPSASQLASLTTTLGYLQSLPTNILAASGFPNNIVGYHPWGNSRYSGLALQMNKRYSKNFMYIAAFTWSHAQDDSTATNFSTILSPRRAQDFQNLRAEWADSALDRRYRLTLTPIYDFKPFQDKGYLMKNVVGNWTFSTTFTHQSPEFATVQSGVDSNLNGDSAGDRSITNPAGAATIGSGVVGYTATGQKVAAGTKTIVAYVATNPNARYIVAALGALSNTGRNTLPLDPINNFDASLMKKFAFTERYHFQIGAQVFNLFNHSQFVGGYLDDVKPFGTASISRNFLIPSNSTFGQYQGYFPSNSRTMQLVAKFTF